MPLVMIADKVFLLTLLEYPGCQKFFRSEAAIVRAAKPRSRSFLARISIAASLLTITASLPKQKKNLWHPEYSLNRNNNNSNPVIEWFYQGVASIQVISLVLVLTFLWFQIG